MIRFFKIEVILQSSIFLHVGQDKILVETLYILGHLEYIGNCPAAGMANSIGSYQDAAFRSSPIWTGPVCSYDLSQN